jgi:hypothetical protein
MSQLQWWTPIPWALALVSIAVALFAFRRNRHPALKIHKMWTDCSARHPDWKYHDHWRVDLLCLGADIFDLELRLECDHSYWHRWRCQSLIRSYDFQPRAGLPNPLKSGQIASFELGDHHFRNLRERKFYDTRVPSQLWPGRVKLVAYHSGRRKLLSRSSWRFRRLLGSFDYLCRHPMS